ncbi:hypothetical protein ACFC0X_25005 [Paenibacillus chitinolyticus]
MSNSKSGYKVPNASSAYVKAPQATSTGKKPTVRKGGDLRTKGSK